MGRGRRATLPLVPAVVDVVRPVPVIAAGGVADGRGLAAVPTARGRCGLGGHRFPMAEEANVHDEWRGVSETPQRPAPVREGLRWRLAGLAAPGASQQHRGGVGAGRTTRRPQASGRGRRGGARPRWCQPLSPHAAACPLVRGAIASADSDRPNGAESVSAYPLADDRAASGTPSVVGDHGKAAASLGRAGVAS